MKEVKDNILKWFIEEFVPNASEDTMTALLFLYRKYGDELAEKEEARDFIRDQKTYYKTIPVDRKNLK